MLFLIFYIIVVLCSCYILIVHIFATFMSIEYIYLSSDNLYCFVQNCVFHLFCWRICAVEKYKLDLHLYCYSKTWLFVQTVVFFLAWRVIQCRTATVYIYIYKGLHSISLERHLKRIALIIPVHLSLMWMSTDLISGFCQQSPEIWAFRSDLFSISNLFCVRVHLVKSESSSSSLPTDYEILLKFHLESESMYPNSISYYAIKQINYASKIFP